MTTFTARYGGNCGACDTRIKPGDEVAYSATDELVHVQCPDVEQRPARGSCSSCFIELPVTGVCGECS
ncbi:hypothetical protein HMPREF0063_11935 [Aeromicrobium marinum DSM 15272]|uniref:Uncharacterized protein n=1 Tax=Aeromicrobium marinum DSM 15272 TaxID=585531 RepID=E2SDZ9_9ACTN|nr:hypothetical protein [Aeromicrobium marinum]EFQ82726.1 hypothetical protein HMPREF0063_11935 [Aeromicrobium marinum DSM 15272]